MAITKEGSRMSDGAGNPLIGDAQSHIADQSTTAATQSTPWGFASQAQADAIATKINSILAALENHGLLKSA